MERRPLRFGVMLPAVDELPRYQRDILEELEDLDDVSLALLIVGKSPRSERPLHRRLRWSQAFFQAYRTLVLNPEAAAQVSLPSRYRAVPRIEVRPRLEGRYSEYFPEDAVDEIRSRDLDFILRFSFGILRGAVLEAARYGIWSFHHDDERRYRGGPPAFWEVYHDDPTTGFILQRLTEELDGGVILARGSVPTVPVSYEENLSQALLASRELPVRVCRRILDTGEPGGKLSPTDAPLYSYPTNGEFLLYCGKILTRRVNRAVGQLVG